MRGGRLVEGRVRGGGSDCGCENVPFCLCAMLTLVILRSQPVPFLSGCIAAETFEFGAFSPPGLRKRRSASSSLAGGSPHIPQFGAIAEQDEEDPHIVSQPAVQSRSPKVSRPQTRGCTEL